MPERFIGRMLGKFRVDALIGSGGFAWVYRAFDPELEVAVALKVLKPQYAGDEQFEQRFRREASIAARLRHPNIISIFAVGKEGDAVYFAMDYLPQGLPDRLEVMTTLPEPLLTRMGIDVASALAFAHREGVIHRDIKVDNILFDEHGNAIVADFGIARAVTNYSLHTGTNMVVGTPQYFSPEQARGQTLDGRADIYSLGVTLYRSATGVLPFTGDDWYEIARQHVEERPARPREHNPALSREIERIIMRCLEKEPSDRYDTGDAVAQALASLSFDRTDTVAIRTVGGPSPSELPTAPLIPPAEKHRRLLRRVAAGGVLAAAAIVATWVAFRAWREPPVTALPTPPAQVATTPPASAASPAAIPVAPPARPHDSASSHASAAHAARQGGKLPSSASGTKTSRPVAPAARATRPADQASATAASAAAQNASEQPAETGFGTVRLYARPEGAVYSFESLQEEGRVIKGHTPVSNSITLPVGLYALTISARYCASYRDTVRIALNHAAAPVRVKLVCAG